MQIFELSPSALDQLSDRGFVVQEQALPASWVRSLAAEWERREAYNSFAPAGIGQGSQLHRHATLRSDFIHWLAADDPEPVVGHWFAQVRHWMQQLNENFYLSLNAFECHFARYDPGSFYRKHIDRFQGDESRKLSLILFLNEFWQDSDGGELVIYDPEHQDLELGRIRPELGTLVLFQSDRFPHEVLPPGRRRLSLTGWLKSMPGHEALAQGTLLR